MSREESEQFHPEVQGEAKSRSKNPRKRVFAELAEKESDLNCQSSSSSSETDEQGLVGKEQSSYSGDLLTTQSNYEPIRRLSETESCFANSEIGLVKRTSPQFSSDGSIATSSNDTDYYSSLITKAHLL